MKSPYRTREETREALKNSFSNFFSDPGPDDFRSDRADVWKKPSVDEIAEEKQARARQDREIRDQEARDAWEGEGD